MRVLLYWLIAFLSMTSLGCSQPNGNRFEQFVKSSAHTFDVYISGGTIVDGSGGAAFQADLLISGNEIVFIGKVDSSRIELATQIDASGQIISPGFIDTHAHGDPLKTPEFDNFLSMGVTTITLGLDGFSPPYADLSDWMNEVDTARPAVNIIPFVGHSTLRELAKVNYEPNPSEAQIASMGNLLQQALDAGCWGMSTGLEYLPGSMAKQAELDHLAKIVGRNEGLIMSHIRNEDAEAIDAAIEELLRQGQYCDVHISHIKIVYGKGEERARILLEKLRTARVSGQRISADLYPYTASYTGIGIVFPAWAKAPNAYEQVKRDRRTELADFLRTRVKQRNGPEATLFGTVPYAGKTLAQLAQELEKPFEEVLIDDIGPTGASAAYFVMNEQLQETLLKDSSVMICSDGSPTMRHPRGYGTFARIIEEFVYKRASFSLEEAIHKMTYLSAQTLKLKDRGLIAEGMKADLLIFNPRNIREMANFETPHQLAKGFTYVMLNGKLAIEKARISPHRYGKVLRKASN